MRNAGNGRKACASAVSNKAADGRYRSAGTFSTEERALAVAEEAERHAAEVAGGAAGGLDPAPKSCGWPMPGGGACACVPRPARAKEAGSLAGH
jgi:hypothetical protein